MAIKLDLPEEYRGPYNLIWASDNGKTVDWVGVNYVLDGQTHEETWEVGKRKPQDVIDKEVLPFLRETYQMDDGGLPPAPEPVVAPPSPDFTKVATRRGDQ